MLQLIIFVVASAGLVYVSRASLRHPRSHGFYRFCAWEAILALVLLNAAVWFRDPFSWHQIVSWTLLVIAIIPLALGVYRLNTARRSEQERPDAALLGFEKTAELVTVGVYRFIRHPMYSSLLLLAWAYSSRRRRGRASRWCWPRQDSWRRPPRSRNGRTSASSGRPMQPT
ncbi:MAG: isoprenylcysteine carboxylmethyltransferase family protein [Chloroflexi bacterium]|nr:isoprenylcysteine carboxylmethyltransferase family protein [Chloroflexota bacterium]